MPRFRYKNIKSTKTRSNHTCGSQCGKSDIPLADELGKTTQIMSKCDGKDGDDPSTSDGSVVCLTVKMEQNHGSQIWRHCCLVLCGFS